MGQISLNTTVQGLTGWAPSVPSLREMILPNSMLSPFHLLYQYRIGPVRPVYFQAEESNCASINAQTGPRRPSASLHLPFRDDTSLSILLRTLKTQPASLQSFIFNRACSEHIRIIYYCCRVLNTVSM